MKTRYLIVGTNAAGFYEAERLRVKKSDSIITAVNSKKYLLYKRSKINKKNLHDQLNVDYFLLAPKNSIG